MAELLGVGQKFDEINVPIHQSLTAHLDDVKKRDIRQGSVKLGQMRAGAPSEQIITMPFLKEKMKEFGSGEFEVSGICNPWHLFDPSLLASPTVTIRREAIDEIKATFLQKKTPWHPPRVSVSLQLGWTAETDCEAIHWA